MPKRIVRDRCNKNWDEHAGYRSTGDVELEQLPHMVKVWRVFRCQCGSRKSLMR
jgi:hypothetical protein